jgi:hypothetical protein
MIVRAHDDRIDISREHACCIFRRLALTDHELVARRKERLTPELLHRHFKRNPRTQAGLLEQECQRPPPQQRRRRLRPRQTLKESRHLEHGPQLIAREIGNLQDAPPAQGIGRGWRRNSHFLYIYTYAEYLCKPFGRKVRRERHDRRWPGRRHR